MLRGRGVALLGFGALTLLYFCNPARVQTQTRPPATQAAPQGQSTSPTPPTSAQAPVQPQEAALHFITVTFDYDFGKTPACSAKKRVHPCVSQFAVYETTNGNNRKPRIFLFNVPLPAKPVGLVKGITAQSPKKINFVLGQHKLQVSALDANGSESTLLRCDSCATWVGVEVGPSTTPSVPARGDSTMPPGATPTATTAPAPKPTSPSTAPAPPSTR